MELLVFASLFTLLLSCLALSYLLGTHILGATEVEAQTCVDIQRLHIVRNLDCIVPQLASFDVCDSN